MRIRILIADDHALVAEGLEYVIAAQSDFEVVGRAADGQEALQRALELEPDIVVMDMAMPGMNGIEATRAIHDRIPGARVIMLSMYTNPEYVYRALEAGASGYIVKRSAAREVVDAIRAVMERVPFAAAGKAVAASVFRPYLVGSSDVAAVVRHPEVSGQVWSAMFGYPGDPAYREFHRKDERSGIRYWRVPDMTSGLGDKADYVPHEAALNWNWFNKQ
jgi:DNA-binding response OmpR family regulator